MLNKILLSCDIHGLKPYFLINKERSFKTQLGGIISLLSYFFILFSIWISGKELINKEHPNLIITSYNDEVPQQLNITNDNFFIAIGIADSNSANYIENKVYNVSVYKKTMLRQKDGSFIEEEIPIELIRCSEKNISILPEIFKLIDLKNMHCLKDGIFKIAGTFGNQIFEYLDYHIKICNNSTDQIICKSSEEINHLISGGYFNIFMTDLNIAPSNFLNPFTHFSKNFYTSITYSIHKEYNIFLKKIEVNSDSGWFVEDIKSDYSFNLDSDKEMWYFRNTDAFFRLVLRCSPYRQVFNRIYSKVQTVAAEIGGIIKFLLVLGYLINFYFRQLLFASFLSDKFYKTNINIKELKYKEITPSQLNEGSKSTTSQNDLSCNNFMKQDNYRKVILGFQNKNTKLRKTLTLNNKEILLSLFFCKINPKLKEKINFTKKAQKKLEAKFDLVNFIKIHFDINMIKKIILNKEQNILMHLIHSEDFREIEDDLEVKCYLK
jgi:hypothetical protein